MAKKRKKYLVTVNSEAFACSLVTNPAMEELFVSFSEDQPLIEKFADESKHMLTGVVAIPNKPIYRRNKDGEEYDIVFSEEAIEKMAMDYMRNYRQNEVTLQHQEEANGVYLVEQWIKQDSYRDKSAVIGLSEDLPVGSWIQTYYVDSNEVWQRIQSGELRGLSLECALGLEEFESQIEQNDTNMNIETNEEMFFDKIKNVFKEVLSSVGLSKENEPDPIEPIDMEDLAAASGFSSVEDYKKEVEAIKAELEEQNAEPTPEPTPEPAAEPKPAEEPKPDAATHPAEEPKVEEPKPAEPEPEPAQDNHLEELIRSLKDEVEALKKMNSGLNSKVKELSKQPSAQPVNVNAKPTSNDTYSAWREQMRQML